MELQQKVDQNGQEVQTGDINNIGTYALMDDRVLAEVLRMLPNEGGAVSKVVLPFGVDAAGTEITDYSSGTVFTKQSADAKVFIAPFRAVVGARTASSSNGVTAWRDIRSGICVAGEGVWSASPPTTLSTAQVIAANSSGNARWDVIYAIITPDTNQAAVARAVKAPTSGAVTTPNTVTQLACQVTLGYAQGTATSSPIFPVTPSDGAGSYYVALAYVLVPDGFNGTSIVKPWMICPAETPPIGFSKGLGGMNAGPANQLNLANGQVVSGPNQSAWANNSTSSISARPRVFMPPSMVGAEIIFGSFDFTGPTSSDWSHQSLSNVDTSRDWRNRWFMVFWQAQQTSGGHFAWDRGASTTTFVPTWSVDGTGSQALAGNQYFTFGQSFIIDGANLPGSPPSNASVASFVSNTQLNLVDAGTGQASVALYVDQASGKLKVYVKGTTATCLLWYVVLASRPFSNY